MLWFAVLLGGCSGAGAGAAGDASERGASTEDGGGRSASRADAAARDATLDDASGAEPDASSERGGSPTESLSDAGSPEQDPSEGGLGTDAAVDSRDAGSVAEWLGPRCTDCETPCVDDSVRPPDPLETCTEPSVFSDVGTRFNLVLTMPDGTRRYLVDSPFDSSDWDTSWSYDSLGNSWYSQRMTCGEVSITSLRPGVVDPDSPGELVVTIDGRTYASTREPSSVTLESNGRASGRNDPFLGPLFDLSISGTLVGEDGDTVTLEGTFRNFSVGASPRGLERLDDVVLIGPGSRRPRLAIGQGKLVAMPVLGTGGPSGAVLLERDLSSQTEVAFPESASFVSLLPDDGFVAFSGSFDPFLLAFEPDGSLRWKTPMFAADYLFERDQLPLARADGSVCIAIGAGERSANPDEPSVLVCSDPSGALRFESAIYPIIEPLSATELLDGTIVVADARSPVVKGIAPDGSERFSFEGCIPPAPDSRDTYFMRVPPARDAQGGGIATVRNDLLAFTADGTLRFRVLIPLGYSEPLVAADGTIYAMSAYAARVVALSPDGEVKWSRSMGSWGALIGLAQDGTLYVSSGGWADYALLSALRPDGSIAWSEQTTIDTWMLAPEGDLYGYGYQDEFLIHVAGDAPMADAPWPAPRGGARVAGTR